MFCMIWEIVHVLVPETFSIFAIFQPYFPNFDFLKILYSLLHACIHSFLYIFFSILSYHFLFQSQFKNTSQGNIVTSPSRAATLSHPCTSLV